MKQFKPVIICAAVLLVISIAVFAATKLIKEPAEEVTPVVPDDTESIMVCDVPYADVASVSVASEDGESFSVSFENGGVMQDNLSGLLYDGFRLEDLRSYASRLAAKEELAKDSGTDADFGLDTPRREITLLTKKGEEICLLLGDSLPVGDGAYLRRRDSENVYIIGRYAEEIFLRKKTDYRDAELFEKIESSEKILAAEYTPYGKKTIRIKKRSQEDSDASLARYKVRIDYMMTSPVTIGANPDTYDSEFLSKIVAISGMAVCEDNPKDLSVYGLDKPAKLTFETKDGKVSLLIGKNANVGGTYVMQEGVPSVILTENPVGLENLSHINLAYKLLWFFAADEVKSFEYKLAGGETHKLEMTVADNKIEGKYDGDEASDKNAKNLYLRTIRLNLAGEVEAGAKFASAPAITVRATLRNGETSTLALHEMNERQFAASIDGARADFFVPVAEVRELLESFAIISRGEEIPDMF